MVPFVAQEGLYSVSLFTISRFVQLCRFRQFCDASVAPMLQLYNHLSRTELYFLSVAEKRAAGDVWRNVSRQSHICVSQYSIGSINSSAGEQTCSSSWNSDIAQLHREPADGSEVISTVM